MKRKMDPKYGIDGEFYVDGKDEDRYHEDKTVVDNNKPPSTQPGLWCGWCPSDDGKHIEWDEGEKFYEYVTWLKYLIEKILSPKGYILNGDVFYQGEDSKDSGYIVVRKNHVIQMANQIISFDTLSKTQLVGMAAENNDPDEREVLKLLALEK